jgi:hypothetical protein
VKIPKVVKIGCHRVDVLWDEDCCGEDGEQFLGKAQASLNRITMRKRDDDGLKMPESVLADTFLHEVLHLVSQNYGVDLTEAQVAGVAGGLLGVIRDNELDFRGK